MPPATRKSAGVSPQHLDRIALGPIVLLKGAEGYFVDSVTEHLTGLARERDSRVEVIRVDAAGYQPHELDTLVSPSLFEEKRHLVIDGVEAATDAFIAEMVDYVSGLQPELADVSIVLRHQRGVRGKKLLDVISKSGFLVVSCEPLKRDTEKIDFLTLMFRDAQRVISKEALQSLVEATGADLRELAAAARQLIADTSGRITPQVVQQYYGGRVEATGFKVADLAVSGDSTKALTHLRHALATGVDPVPIVSALAMKLRTIALVAGLQSRRVSTAEIGLAPWQIDRARRELRGWSPEGLAVAITAVADADAAVKGESRDPAYAVERAILTISGAYGFQR